MAESRAWSIDNVGTVSRVALWYGPKHARHGQQAPGHSFTRALGMTSAADVGVSNEPQITAYSVRLEDEFLVLGSATLWAAGLSDEHIVGNASRHPCGEMASRRIQS